MAFGGKDGGWRRCVHIMRSATLTEPTLTLPREIGAHFAELVSQPAYPVFKDRADHFVYDVVEAALTFERGADGKVTALVLHQNGIDQRATRAAQ